MRTHLFFVKGDHVIVVDPKDNKVVEVSRLSAQVRVVRKQTPIFRVARNLPAASWLNP